MKYFFNTLQRSQTHEYVERGIPMKDTETDLYIQIFHAIINQRKHTDYYDSSLLTSKYSSNHIHFCKELLSTYSLN
jgi:hypothetical protein